jgi:signal transduction histidine kinase
MRDELIRISEDVHDLSYRLHPSIVDDLGLIAALRAECSRTARSSDIEVDVRVGDVPEQIAPDVALCLFRVAQESLRNVVRHAHARSVDVSLERIGDALRLVASDDGKGFAQERRGGLGLSSMRERVRQLGGRLSVDSAPGRGTSVTASVPLAAVAQ